MSHETLQTSHDACRNRAEQLAGGLLDIPRRASILAEIYRDSGRNHTFSLMAAHGALWAFGYFETGGALGRLIAKRYRFNRSEYLYRLGILREFAEGFRAVNRQVCIDSHTNYHFTKQHGEEPGADAFVPAELLDALNRVHHAARRDQLLTDGERREIFERSFRNEQEVTVAPGVQQAIAGFECRVMQFLCLHPIVRFAYFPAWRALVFRNFGNQAERIAQGLRAFDLAARVGWTRAYESLAEYGVMDPTRLGDDAHPIDRSGDGVVSEAGAAG